MPSIFDWSKTPANNATADANINWQEGQPPSTVNNSARQMMARVKEFIDDTGAVAAVGTANAITVTLSSGVSAYFEGLQFSFKAANTNTAAVTLSVNGIGARNVYAEDGGAVTVGQIKSGLVYNAVYLAALNSGAGGFLLRGSSATAIRAVKTGNYTAVDGDHNAVLHFTSSAVLSIAAVASLRPDWNVEVWADDGAVVRFSPNSTETINGVLDMVIQRGQKAIVWCDGTALFAKVTSDAQSGPQARGFISGLTLANNSTDATNDLDIAAGSASADTSPYNVMTLGSALTKRTDAAWAAGTGNGGWLDGASMPDGTGHAFLIQRSDTGVTDIGFSASLSPTLPTNYDRKRRIGSIIRAGGTILGFTQDGDDFTLTTAVLDVDVTNQSTTMLIRTLTVPTGINVYAKIRAFGSNSSAWVMILFSTLESNAAPSGGVAPLGSLTGAANTNDITTLVVRTDTSASIRSRSSAASTVLRIATYGWIDTRGRLA